MCFECRLSYFIYLYLKQRKLDNIFHITYKLSANILFRHERRLMYIVVSHTPLRFTLCSLGTSSEAHILSFHIHQKFHASLGKRKSFLEHFFFFQLFTFVLKVILWVLCSYSCHTECIKWNTDIKNARLIYSKKLEYYIKY